METKEYKTIDRVAAGWPAGPWDGEPDKVQWQDAATGLPCLAVRGGSMGNWCGYVGVPENHPSYKKEYSDLDVSVHGGLTYADKCQPGETEASGICHTPSPGESDDVWWLGFDCAHFRDTSPGYHTQAYLKMMSGISFLHDGSTYRTLEYVKQECTDLARQLAEIK